MIKAKDDSESIPKKNNEKFPILSCPYKAAVNNLLSRQEACRQEGLICLK